MTGKTFTEINAVVTPVAWCHLGTCYVSDDSNQKHLYVLVFNCDLDKVYTIDRRVARYDPRRAIHLGYQTAGY
jgi:PhoPQ-activated pathogenicity-related protein